MAQLEITIRYTPLNGTRRVTQNVLTETDTTLDNQRIGEIVGMNIRHAAGRAYGFNVLGRHNVTLINGEALLGVQFDGFETVPESNGRGSYSLVDYVKLTRAEREISTTRAVRLGSIQSVEKLPN